MLCLSENERLGFAVLTGIPRKIDYYADSILWLTAPIAYSVAMVIAYWFWNMSVSILISVEKLCWIHICKNLFIYALCILVMLGTCGMRTINLDSRNVFIVYTLKWVQELESGIM